jgi:thiol-disulfide isomerase/thioredoxin
VRNALRIVLMAAALLLHDSAVWAQGFEVLQWPAGKRVPQSLGTDLQEHPRSLKEFRGKAILVNFWASWCEPCVAEMPSLQALAQRHGSEHLVVLAMNFKEAAPTAERFVQRNAIAIPVLLDSKGDVARAWGANVFPTTVLISADGRVQAVVRGALDWAGPQADALVSPLLARSK